MADDLVDAYRGALGSAPAPALLLSTDLVILVGRDREGGKPDDAAFVEVVQLLCRSSDTASATSGWSYQVRCSRNPSTSSSSTELVPLMTTRGRRVCVASVVQAPRRRGARVRSEELVNT